MTAEQEYFIRNVNIIISPQEKTDKTKHITEFLTRNGVKYEKLYAPNNLKEGDYSFVIDGEDYRGKFLIERKFGIEELVGCLFSRNIQTKAKKETSDVPLRDNLEYEFARMCKKNVTEKWLFIENCHSLESIKQYSNGFEKRNITAGNMVYSTLLSWSCNNRYAIKIECVEHKSDFAKIMLNKMFYFWRNEMKIRFGDNFLSKLRKIT